jgi:hypothetical protein
MKIRIILFCVALFSVDGVFANSDGIFNITPSNGGSCLDCHTGGGAFNYTANLSPTNSLAPVLREAIHLACLGLGRRQEASA